MTTAYWLHKWGFTREAYPKLYAMPLDWAIGEIRRLRRVDREYYAGLNRRAV